MKDMELILWGIWLTIIWVAGYTLMFVVVLLIFTGLSVWQIIELVKLK